MATRLTTAAAQKEATRRRFLAAGVRLMEKGNYRPSRQEIADEINMHRRSFQEHFGTVENYMAALLKVFEAEVTTAILKDHEERNVPIARLVVLGKRK